MQLRTVRPVLTLLAIASGSALSQVDSAAGRTETAAPTTASSAATDTSAAPSLVPPAPDTSSTPAATVESPRVAPVAAPSAPGSSASPRWSFEATTSYGWRMGQLLREEDRLTREFNIVLVDADNDSSNVRPIASGTSIQASGWWNATEAQRIGLGFGFGRFYEHPVTSYSRDLSEAFFDQYLVTARYRYTHPLSRRWHLFGELAFGWNHSRIERIPLVAAHRDDDRIKFKQVQLDQIALLHRASTVDGVHGQVGGGLKLALAQAWSLSLSGSAAWDRIWFERSVSAKVEGSTSDPGETLSDSPAYWGFDLGFAVARDF